MNEVDVVTRVIFLVSMSALGWGVGKKFQLNPKAISTLLIYVISPIVMFTAVLQAPVGANYLAFTLGALLACCVMATLALLIAPWLWRDSTQNLFAFAAGTGNTGYFGLPLAMGLFGDQGLAIAVFIILGVNLYEFSYGYYLSSRANYSIRQSLKKVITMPLLYAFGVAMLFSASGIELNDTILSGLANFKGAYSVLGMMVIGMTMAQFKQLAIDWKFLMTTLSWKYLAWPCFALLLILTLPLDATAQSIVLLMACVPMAGNTVVIANDLDLHPEKAATAVMVSTLLAIVAVPLFLALLKN